MRYNKKELHLGLAPSRRLSRIISHRMFKTACIATMVVLITLILVLTLTTRTKAQAQAQGINLTVSSTGGNASSPLLYGIMFEVRKRSWVINLSIVAMLTNSTCRISTTLVLQQLFRSSTVFEADVVVNTYRGWRYSRAVAQKQWIPGRFA